MAEKRKVYMRPKDDSYKAFKSFLDSFAQALSPGLIPEEEDAKTEELTKAAYQEYLRVRRSSGEPLVNAGE